MACLAGVDEKGRRSCGRKGRRELLSDMAALAHAGDDHPAAGGADALNGFLKRGAEIGFERKQHGVEAGSLGFHGAARGGRGIAQALVWSFLSRHWQDAGP